MDDMRHFKLCISVSVVYLFLTMPIGLAETKTESKAVPKWSEGMKAIASEMSVLTQFLFDREKFKDPANSDQILKSLRIIRDRVSALSIKRHAPVSRKVDALESPVFDYIGSRIQEKLSASTEAFESKDFEYSRRVINGAISYCVSCHTVGHVGTRNPFKNFSDQLQKISQADRIEFLATTRQYNTVLSEFSRIMSDKESAEAALSKDELRSLRIAMAAAVRVRHDPREALALLDKVSDFRKLPEVEMKTISVWRKSLLVWINDHSKEKKPPVSIADAEIALIHARELKETEGDARGDVEFLRAIEVANEVVRLNLKDDNAEIRAQAYLRLGEAYNELQELGFWGLHEYGFESCVRANPRSGTAKTCFERYQGAVEHGFSGSRPVKLPYAIAQHLDLLKEMSRPKTRDKTK